MLVPALAVLGLFFLLPVLGAFLLGFTDFDLYALGDSSNARFVGLANYGRVLSDPLFWKSLRNTAFFVVAGGPLTVGLALFVAVLLAARLVRFRSFFRSIFFAPVVTTLVAVSVVWKYLYQPRSGLLNVLLGWAGLPAVDWLGDPAWAMPAIILMATWKNFGTSVVLFLAGIQAIPESLYEAARIDGASPAQQFRHVTLPLLAPTLLFVGLTTTIGYFQLFAEPYVMTRGGPLHATRSVALHMYDTGFRWWNLGGAAAIAFVLFAVILAVTALQRRLLGGDP
jgi:multiple sugar transport system permease protein